MQLVRVQPKNKSMKNLSNYLVLALICVGMVVFNSCEKAEVDSDINQNSDAIFSEQTNGMIELGSMLENPYSVENMTVAYNLLKSSSTTENKVKTTHYYVRFLPLDYQELEDLEKDTTLILFDYPLDRKIKKGGSYYHDPDISIDKVTWQYTVVPVDYKFIKVEYEILAELYLNENTQKKLKSSHSDDVSYEEIEIQSLKLTGNYSANSDLRLKSAFTPSGRITVMDHVVGGKIGVPYAKIRLKNWFKIREVYTNYNGYFSTETTFNNVDYSIKWETSDYDIRSGIFGQAYTIGPNESTSAWNSDSDVSGDLGDSNIDYGFATVHRAADRYFNGSIGGLNRPFFSSKLKFSVYDKHGTGVNWGNWDFTGILPDIKIWCKKNTSWKNSNTIFSTTIHEIAHATHIKLLYASELQLAFVDKIIRESWADAVEWYITQREYFSRGITNYDVPGSDKWEDHKQGWGKYSNKDYTPLFIDLIDDYNQSVQKYSGNKCPDGGYWDGKHCLLGSIPAGTTPFIYNDRLYYSPVGCCDCPVLDARFDGANCRIIKIPDNVVGMFYNNNAYLSGVGSTIYPYDEITGYDISTIESWLNGIFNISNLESKLKANKPSGITDKHIDLFLDLFYNL